MKYLIYKPEHEPFYTNWFDAENNFAEGMVVFDLINNSYTSDGIVWREIESDHL